VLEGFCKHYMVSLGRNMKLGKKSHSLLIPFVFWEWWLFTWKC
jgi:hypothetical protein